MANPSHVTRRSRGIAQDIANQLAQMAVGVEAMFVGSALEHETRRGTIDVDVVSATASVNGRSVRLNLADYLNKWMTAELARKKLDRSFLSRATVSIEYLWTPGNGDRTDRAEFTAVAHVASNSGETTGMFTNNQPMVLGHPLTNIRDPKGYDLPNQKRQLSWREVATLVRNAAMRPIGRIHLGLSKGRIGKDREIAIVYNHKTGLEARIYSGGPRFFGGGLKSVVQVRSPTFGRLSKPFSVDFADAGNLLRLER